jgi:DNA-directed RNA polymerase specialized sigma24 family protein
MSDSVSEWFGNLKAGRADAARKLWDRYSDKLAALARRRLNGLPKAVSDEDDLAQSVFHSICRGAAAGRFGDFSTRDELWWLLVAITNQKTIDHFRRLTAQKRGLGCVETETGLAAYHPFSMDDLLSSTPTAEFMAILDEQYESLLAHLNDERLRQIAIMRVEGYTVAEIATKLAVGTRAIERKLHLIRCKWASEIFPRHMGV